jgi:hypothetical protein
VRRNRTCDDFTKYTIFWVIFHGSILTFLSIIVRCQF